MLFEVTLVILLYIGSSGLKYKMLIRKIAKLVLIIPHSNASEVKPFS